MPKFVIYITIFTLLVVFLILMLPKILPNRVLNSYNDKQLRQAAMNRGMLPIPKDYQGLMKIKDNAKVLTPQKIALGKKLYFDTKLSKHHHVSCATCHMISKEQKKTITPILSKIKRDTKDTNNCMACHLRDESGTDRLGASIGDNGIENPYHLNTMTILNASLAKYYTWNGEVKSVEDEVVKSITSLYKMNMKSDILVSRLKKDKKYVKDFNDTFHERDALNMQNISKAIGAYVRTLLTRSAYDEFLDGDDNAISQEAKRGLSNFINLGCKGCHTGRSVGGQLMEKFPLKNFITIKTFGYNTPIIASQNFFPFENIGGFLGHHDKQLYRVPILRNVTKTSPYIHNGSINKIKDMVMTMGKYQLGIFLSDKQADEIVAFLKTLEGSIVPYNPTTTSKEGK